MIKDENSTLLTRFKLKSQEEWANFLHFFNPASREDDRSFRQLSANISNDIRAQRVGLPNNAPDVEALPVHVQPLVDLFNRNFKWKADEYILKIDVETEPASAAYQKEYRFTLFESDIEELKSLQDDYKFGFGTLIKERKVGVGIPISEK